jgi:hypothetical protein
VQVNKYNLYIGTDYLIYDLLSVQAQATVPALESLVDETFLDEGLLPIYFEIMHNQ